MSSLERNMGDQRVARRALVNRNERLFLAGADNKVRLPVAKASTLGHDGGAQIDGDLVGNRTASLASAVTLFADLLAAQGVMQCTASTLVGVDALVDAFVANGGFPIRLEVTRDLLRAPGLDKLGINHVPGLAGNAGAVLASLHAAL